MYQKITGSQISHFVYAAIETRPILKLRSALLYICECSADIFPSCLLQKAGGGLA